LVDCDLPVANPEPEPPLRTLDLSRLHCFPRTKTVSRNFGSPRTRTPCGRADEANALILAECGCRDAAPAASPRPALRRQRR
jgi:hypothetical protein